MDQSPSSSSTRMASPAAIRQERLRTMLPGETPQADRDTIEMILQTCQDSFPPPVADNLFTFEVSVLRKNNIGSYPGKLPESIQNFIVNAQHILPNTPALYDIRVQFSPTVTSLRSSQLAQIAQQGGVRLLDISIYVATYNSAPTHCLSVPLLSSELGSIVSVVETRRRLQILAPQTTTITTTVTVAEPPEPAPTDNVGFGKKLFQYIFPPDEEILGADTQPPPTKKRKREEPTT